MKLPLVLTTALVANAVTAHAAAVSVPEIQANSLLGRNLLAHARRLEEENNNNQQQQEEEEWEEQYNWVASYSIKFVRLQCVLPWSKSCAQSSSPSSLIADPGPLN